MTNALCQIPHITMLHVYLNVIRPRTILIDIRHDMRMTKHHQHPNLMACDAAITLASLRRTDYRFPRNVLENNVNRLYGSARASKLEITL
jgi:hypothetical protein